MVEKGEEEKGANSKSLVIREGDTGGQYGRETKALVMKIRGRKRGRKEKGVNSKSL